MAYRCSIGMHSFTRVLFPNVTLYTPAERGIFADTIAQGCVGGVRKHFARLLAYHMPEQWRNNYLGSRVSTMPHHVLPEGAKYLALINADLSNCVFAFFMLILIRC